MSLDDEIVSDAGLDIACQSIPYLFCIGFTLVFAALFSKMWRVNKLFNNPKMRRVKVSVMDVWCKPLFALLFLNILVLALWTGLSPLTWGREDVSLVESVGQCQTDGSLPYVVVLAVLDLGAMIFSLYQAYHARKISLEFAESSYIATAIASILLVCFVGIPVILLTNQPSARFFVFSCIDFVICVSLLLFIFVPKEKFRRGKRSVKTSIRGMAVATNSSMKASRDKTYNAQSSTMTNKTNTSIVSSNSTASDDGGLRILNDPVTVKELEGKVLALNQEIFDLKSRNVELEALVHADGALKSNNVSTIGNEEEKTREDVDDEVSGDMVENEEEKMSEDIDV